MKNQDHDFVGKKKKKNQLSSLYNPKEIGSGLVLLIRDAFVCESQFVTLNIFVY